MTAQLIAQPKPLSIPDASRQLGISPKTVRRLALSGELPYYRIGKQIRIEQRDLTDWKESKRHGGNAA